MPAIHIKQILHIPMLHCPWFTATDHKITQVGDQIIEHFIYYCIYIFGKSTNYAQRRYMDISYDNVIKLYAKTT